MVTFLRKPSIGLCQPILLCLLVAGGCASLPDETATARNQIESIVAQGMEAARKGDTEAFLSRLPDDYTGLLLNGRVTTKEDLRQSLLNRARSGVETIALTTDIDRIDVKGDAATVWSHQRWERNALGRDGKTHRIVTTQRHEERWRKRSGHWEPYWQKELGGTVMIDGVEVAPPSKE